MDISLIIDGHNLLFQMFFGMPKTIHSKDKILVHATYGFINAVLRTVKVLKASEVLIVFDREASNFRKEINNDYKANRIDYSTVSESDNPFSQLPIIMKSLECLDISYIEAVENYETDDVIASYVIQNPDKIHYIMSYDSDFYQLMNDNVSIYKYKGNNSNIYTVDDFKKSFGIEVYQYVDYKCLVGDTSDNLIGVKNIGKSRARALLNQFSSLEDIKENMTIITPTMSRNAIKENIHVAFENRELIKLNGLTPLPELNTKIKDLTGITPFEAIEQAIEILHRKN